LKILGIRTAPQQIRYALVDYDGTTWTLSNASSENLIRKPAGILEMPEQLKWTYDELERIIRQNPDIDRIGLKTAEYGSREDSSSRTGAYLDALVLLVSANMGIPVTPRLYTQLGTKRATVKADAETRVGRTITAWNEQMADAIAVAWMVSRC